MEIPFKFIIIILLLYKLSLPVFSFRVEEEIIKDWFVSVLRRMSY